MTGISFEHINCGDVTCIIPFFPQLLLSKDVACLVDNFILPGAIPNNSVGDTDADG